MTLPMGPIGMALNGVVFFNPFEQGGMNAVEGYSEVWLDCCRGHPQHTGIYHYHKYSRCAKGSFSGDGHAPVIGRLRLRWVSGPRAIRVRRRDGPRCQREANARSLQRPWGSRPWLL